jgi:hypothetical protein
VVLLLLDEVEVELVELVEVVEVVDAAAAEVGSVKIGAERGLPLDVAAAAPLDEAAPAGLVETAPAGTVKPCIRPQALASSPCEECGQQA